MGYFERLMALEDDEYEHEIHRCPRCSQFTDRPRFCSHCEEFATTHASVVQVGEDFPGEYRDADALPNGAKERTRPAHSATGSFKLYEDDESYG